MVNAFGCFSATYDVRLLALAVAVCAASSFAVFGLLSRVIAERAHASSSILLTLAAVAATADIWTTHFICLVAYQPPLNFGVSAHVTAISLMLLLVVLSMSFTFIIRADRAVNAAIAGTYIGLAIVIMHYADVRGSYLGDLIGWDGDRIVASIGFSLFFAVSSIFVFGKGQNIKRCAMASLLLAIGILSTHFAGMSAMKLLPGSARALPNDLLSAHLLAYAAACVSAFIIGSGLVAFLLDLQTRRESESRYMVLARHDFLTGLPNRLFFQQLVERELTGLEKGGQPAGLVCLDLDGFKEVNDTFGHPMGDAVLIEVAARLKSILGERCFAGRLGGDEFGLFVTGLNATKTAASAAQLVIDAIENSFTIKGTSIDIGCSIGISLCPGHGTSYPALLARGDLALSRAKADGRGVFRFFEPDMEEHSIRRTLMAKELKLALCQKQLHLAYQPKIYVASGRVSGFEALLRWNHPDRGPISPATFIPVAEESGLIFQIGEWALREACREAATWDNKLSVAVNFSPAQFRQSDLVETISRTLAETRLDPHRLEIEITESLFFENNSRSIDVLNRIKALGVSIAIDDFGTGFSCLSTLQAFEFNTIKIDKSFVDKIDKSSTATSIVKAIIQLAASLNMTVVAEGVEVQEQFDFLDHQGCAQIQGYFFGAAHPIEKYSHLVSNVLHAEFA